MPNAVKVEGQSVSKFKMRYDWKILNELLCMLITFSEYQQCHIFQFTGIHCVYMHTFAAFYTKQDALRESLKEEYSGTLKITNVPSSPVYCTRAKQLHYSFLLVFFTSKIDG